MYSRLARRSEFRTKRQSAILIIASVIILTLFIIYGFPAILNLAGGIGNLKGQKITTTDKGLPPMTPRFSQDFEATKSAMITTHGVADSKISVEIFQNGRSLGTTLTKDDGSFSMEADLSRGNNLFTAQAISESGQKSSISDAYKIVYLASPPKLDLSSPKDSDSFKDSPIVVLGTTEPNASVTVNDRLAIVAGSGSFSYNLTLTNGDNKVKIVVTDQAGNQTTKEITVKFNP